MVAIYSVCVYKLPGKSGIINPPFLSLQARIQRTISSVKVFPLSWELKISEQFGSVRVTNFAQMSFGLRIRTQFVDFFCIIPWHFFIFLLFCTNTLYFYLISWFPSNVAFLTQSKQFRNNEYSIYVLFK